MDEFYSGTLNIIFIVSYIFLLKHLLHFRTATFALSQALLYKVIVLNYEVTYTQVNSKIVGQTSAETFFDGNLFIYFVEFIKPFYPQL